MAWALRHRSQSREEPRTERAAAEPPEPAAIRRRPRSRRSRSRGAPTCWSTCRSPGGADRHRVRGRARRRRREGSRPKASRARRVDAVDVGVRSPGGRLQGVAVLPPGIPRVAIEAGVTDFWWKYVRAEGAVIGVDNFGESAPGKEVMKFFHLTVENVVATAKQVSWRDARMRRRLSVRISTAASARCCDRAADGMRRTQLAWADEAHPDSPLPDVPSHDRCADPSAKAPRLPPVRVPLPETTCDRRKTRQVKRACIFASTTSGHPADVTAEASGIEEAERASFAAERSTSAFETFRFCSPDPRSRRMRDGQRDDPLLSPMAATARRRGTSASTCRCSCPPMSASSASGAITADARRAAALYGP